MACPKPTCAPCWKADARTSPLALVEIRNKGTLCGVLDPSRKMNASGAAPPEVAENAAATQPLVDTVRLALVSGVGPRLRQLLLQRFGSPAEILRAPRAELREVSGIGPELAQRIATAADDIDAAAEIGFAWRNNQEILTELDADYPDLLREIHDPPGVLFRRGTPDARESSPVRRCDPERSVAIVGTRRATRYGVRQAEMLAGELARCGWTVVSGLARGIDAAAHRGALAAGGRSVAVLAGGLADIYPPEHRSLAEEIARRGWLLSETPPRVAPARGMFPQRNRIISGLSLGTIVVEAAERSGALITARHAAEQGREVFAVPGPIDGPSSAGCHRLIQDGAKLVHTVDDILDELPSLVQHSRLPSSTVVLETGATQVAAASLDDSLAAVYAAIEKTPTSIDQVGRDCGLPISRVLAAISDLELRRLVTRVSGNSVERRDGAPT